MIPQAITSTGPYADLWSHLKSMAHALSRVEAARDISAVADLDKTRLEALVSFLKQELEPFDATSALSKAGFLTFEASEFSYSFEEDVRTLLEKLAPFVEWQKPQGLGGPEKTAKLIDALSAYSLQLNGGSLPSTPPTSELRIVKELLSALVLRTESALAA